LLTFSFADKEGKKKEKKEGRSHYAQLIHYHYYYSEGRGRGNTYAGRERKGAFCCSPNYVTKRKRKRLREGKKEGRKSSIPHSLAF